MVIVNDTLPCRLLQDDITMMWEPSVVATQVEPYVTDYGIDTVSGGKASVSPFSNRGEGS